MNSEQANQTLDAYVYHEAAAEDVVPGSAASLKTDWVEGAEWTIGSQKCRADLYGAPVCQRLRLVYLSSLPEGDLWLSNAKLPELAAEVQLMSQHIGEIAVETGYSINELEKNLQDLFGAIELAQEIRGGLVLW